MFFIHIFIFCRNFFTIITFNFISFFLVRRLALLHAIGHFTVMDGSEAEGDLVLIQTFLLYYENQVILMLTSISQEQLP